MAVSRKRCGSPKEAFEYFIDDPLEFAPGSETLYTSFGFVLLSAVIEAAAGVPFGSYVETSVLAPAGMAATSIEGLAVEGHETATFYYRRDDDGTFRETSDVDASCKFGGGGFLSTSEDLVRFGLALVEGRLLSDRSLETLWTLYSEPTPSRPGLALGFFSGDSLKEGLGVSEEHYLASWWHGGSGEGGYSALIVYPEHGAAVAVTTDVLASGRLIVAANEIAWEVLAALEAVKSP